MEIKKPGVYFIAFEEKAYVGSSNNPEQRIKQHLSSLRNGKHPNKDFQKTYNGNPIRSTSVVETDSRDDAFDFEQAIIDEGIPAGYLLNKSRDARYCSVVFTDEHRANISTTKKK